MTFRQLLRQVRDVTLAAFSHQELPFEQLMQVLEQERNVDRASLTPVLFNYQKTATLPLERAGLTFAPLPSQQFGTHRNQTITSFDLILDIWDASTKLTGTLTHKTEIFNVNSVGDLVESFNRTLQDAVS